MKTGIGIDTGGTYTDAVLYDFEKRRVLASSKALTTREDLTLGIGAALDALPADMLREADIISLSTTLATNACVENKGGRAKLLLIGVSKGIVADVGKNYGLPEVEQMYFIDGKTNSKGEVIGEPDWESFARDSAEWLRDAYSVGVVEIHAMNNNAVLEKKAREVINGIRDIPVICGHELFTDLNSIQRGSSTLLNAMLIPIIEDFLRSIKAALAARSIKAPVVIVRSDGTIMSESFTTVRPVETLLCGPAASIMGGLELSHERDCLVVDMGGTTTDIAIVRDGSPVRATDGINVGKWRTFVKGVYIDTFGLGGDSAVRFDKWGHMTLESNRVVPLCIAASKWPSVRDKLSALLQTKLRHTEYLHEFFMLVRDIPDSADYTPAEKSFCEALRNGPLILSEAAEAAGTDVYNLNMRRLEKEGVVIRCGLTPTDFMHINGDFCEYDAEASRLGAEFVAACVELTPEELLSNVYDAVKAHLYTNIVRILLEHKYPHYRKGGLGKGLEALIAASWREYRAGEAAGAGFFGVRFETPAALVGVGAPVHIFLPDVARALGTRCVVPGHAGVANALGALVGNIAAHCSVEIRPQYNNKGVGNYIVYGVKKNSSVSTKEEAVAIAAAEAREEARREVERRGAAGDIIVTDSVTEDIAEARDKTPVFLGVTVTAKAVGRLSV